MTPKKAKKKAAAPPPPPEPDGCECLGYEPSEDDDDIGMSACVCGHTPEEHNVFGCTENQRSQP